MQELFVTHIFAVRDAVHFVLTKIIKVSFTIFGTRAIFIFIRQTVVLWMKWIKCPDVIIPKKHWPKTTPAVVFTGLCVIFYHPGVDIPVSIHVNFIIITTSQKEIIITMITGTSQTKNTPPRLNTHDSINLIN